MFKGDLFFACVSKAGTAQVAALERPYCSKAKALNKLPNTNPAWVLLGFSYVGSHRGY